MFGRAEDWTAADAPLDAWMRGGPVWPKPPFDDETIRRVGQVARTLQRVYHHGTLEYGGRRIVDHLAELVELLIADHDSYEVVER